MGIPVIGCSCHVCTSTSSFNKRMRPSVLLEVENKRFLIDCGPDFRQQALHYQLNHLDGIIFTHSHYDHSCGIDELRIYTFRQENSLPCLLSQETYQDLLVRFGYIFHTEHQKPKHTNLDLQIFSSDSGTLEFCGMKIKFFSYIQGGMKVAGYRFGDLAFLTDIKHYEESIFEFLKDVKTLVISALRFTPSPLHLSIDEAIDFSKKVNPAHTWLTHIAHETDHKAGNAYLPANIRLAYDGLRISFNPYKA